jgi:ferredoxin
MPDLTLRIDEGRCQGHAICYLLAPDLFQVDEEGRGSVVTSHVDADSIEHAQVAVERCPERAVLLD